MFNIDVEAVRQRDSKLTEKLKPLSAHLRMLKIIEPGGNQALDERRPDHEASEWSLASNYQQYYQKATNNRTEEIP